MSVIIRLQNLPWSANALDIRQYFHGLSIPEGGVHIVGGELGDAFIAFSTDEDARQAFMRNNGKIKEIQITLMLSSRTEMQRVIEQARSQSYAAFMQSTPLQAAPPVVPLPSAVPTIMSAIPGVKRDSKEKEKIDKRDSRRRSRSKSRERKDRSRERKERRHRNRSRSRSRDRKSNRRRERSRSRDRSRSRERKNRDRRRSTSDERQANSFSRISNSKPDTWNKNKSMDNTPATSPSPNFPGGMNQPNRSLDSMNAAAFTPGNGMAQSQFNRPMRDSWPSMNSTENNFQNNNRPSNFRNVPDNFQSTFPRNQNKIAPNRFDTENCSVALEPFYGGYGQIRKFFHGLIITGRGIKIINDQNGHSTGVVYVQFAERKFKELALRRGGKLLNGCTVEISHIADEEFEEATDKYHPPRDRDDMHENDNPFKTKNIPKFFNSPSSRDEPINFSCLTVDDLPTYCKEQDILHMFSQHPLVALILTNKKRGGFIAYVKFSSPEVAQKALEEIAHHIVGGKPVTVTPCKDEEFDEINKKHEVTLNCANVQNIGTDCLSVSGLPEKTNDKDIADFFSDIGVIPTKIHLMSNSLGFTGQAYCEFATIEEASRAAMKNQTSLGNVSISVLSIKREEMEKILGTTLPAPDPVMTDDLLKPKDSPDKFALRDPMPPMVGNTNFNNVQNPARPTYPPQLFDMRGPRFGPRSLGPGSGPGSGPGLGPGSAPTPGLRPRFTPPKDIFEDVPPGCTVFMKNVPYKANTNDILNFFEGFNHTSNVSRRYNANNLPSDEAKIIFFEAEEASRAVRELQKEKIWDRSIFLHQE